MSGIREYSLLLLGISVKVCQLKSSKITGMESWNTERHLDSSIFHVSIPCSGKEPVLFLPSKQHGSFGRINTLFDCRWQHQADFVSVGS